MTLILQVVIIYLSTELRLFYCYCVFFLSDQKHRMLIEIIVRFFTSECIKNGIFLCLLKKCLKKKQEFNFWNLLIYQDFGMKIKQNNMFLRFLVVNLWNVGYILGFKIRTLYIPLIV